MAKLRDLNTARRQIDAIDSELVESLARRLKVARELANLKREAGLKIRQPDRERAVLEAVAAKAKRLGVSPRLVRSLFRQIIDESVREEEETGKKGRGRRKTKTP
ncbi:MAG: hypothetical protein A2126_00795 [Candidatus Woykebacteria bacterium GWB1_45_5]|uniref:Chorismate mutase domain-containing protein n=2 Tax=Candidatus Woykeibacteriota TaxID=1817899 RepID=A0A1G1W208_9BACT|nr:MAG: hypothetical protein A2113_04160 [Candidatus Woykebacteria bacterium GWA1_44_8]OGY24821.1 MAG: hypothetical protein A2126_00795 [Candidatus Woykebacteria bacterium GWB1_45_5]